MENKLNEDTTRSISLAELVEILSLTIKHDEANKLLTFLGMLSAYVENSQLNIAFNAPSSTGKSYIPIEVAQYFPKEDVVQVGYCSSKAFFHDYGKYDTENNQYVVDFRQKIIVFLDQPHPILLENMRTVLSHDLREINNKIADKKGEHGTKTKNVNLVGSPAVVFCSAALKMDEQECTRFILLSPEANQDKIGDSILQRLKKEADGEAYRALLETDERRLALKQRTALIKKENIKEIKISSTQKIEKYFLERAKFLKPKDVRDVGKVVSLVKALALLNLWSRERDGQIIIANDQDVEDALSIWEKISESQVYNLPPYVYEIYKSVIVPCWEEKLQENPHILGVSRGEIILKHAIVVGKPLPDWQLRQQIIPMLEAAGLIAQEADPLDRRRILIRPSQTSRCLSSLAA